MSPALATRPADERPDAPSRRRPLRNPGVAVVLAALAITIVAYGVRTSTTAAEPDAYIEFALSDAQDITTPPLAADGPVGIPLADAATQSAITRIEAATATSASPGQLALLARLLVQRAAVTGDVATYGRAATALDEAVRTAPADLTLRAQRAATRISLHDFTGAAQDADRVLRARPDDIAGLSAAYDAAVELGSYDTAATRLASLTRQAPGSPHVLFRQSRWASLHGDRAGAVTLAARARVAATSAGAVGTARATYDLLAGRLALDDGRYAVAISAYESALASAPGWHAALAGLGRARAAAGDLVGAEQALSAAADTVPLPETLTSLGDVRTALGDLAGASVAYGTIDVVAQLEAAQQLFNRAIVLSWADRGVRSAAAVRDARADLSTRRDVYGYDALGWALLADGQVRQAVRYADRSLSLGTLDPRVLAHAGLAHAAAGHTQRARDLLRQSLSLSPTLDPRLTPRITSALARLSSASKGISS